MTLLEKDVAKIKEALNNATTEKEKIFYARQLLAICTVADDMYNVETDSDTIIDRALLLKVCNDSGNLRKQACKKLMSREYNNLTNRIINTTLPQIKTIDTPYQLEKIYTLKQARKLVLDFYSNYGNNSYRRIKKYLNDEHLHIITKINNDPYYDTFAYCNYNIVSNNSHIVAAVNGKLDLADVSALVHEIGHALHFKAIKTMNTWDNVIFGCAVEMPSTTMQKLFIDFAIKNNIAQADELNINLLVLLKSFMKNVKTSKLLLSYLRSRNSNSFVDDHAYIYGTLLAYYYAEKYKQDPEQTKENIQRFIRHIGYMNEIEMLDKFGIDKKELIEGKYIKKNVMESTQNIHIDKYITIKRR